MPKSVIPLESNPEVFSQLATRLGLSPVLEFHDIYSLTDPDLLAFLPQPVFGIILLFPITAGFEQYRQEQDAEKEQQTYHGGDINWFRQTIGNACGLYGLLHILANLPRDFIIENSLLNDVFKEIGSLPEEEVPSAVERLENTINLDANFGSQGQTDAPEPGSETILHFASFIKGKDGHLYELDGRRKGPIDLGKVDGSFFNQVAEKVQAYMDMADDKNKMNFAMMGLASA